MILQSNGFSSEIPASSSGKWDVISMDFRIKFMKKKILLTESWESFIKIVFSQF